MQFDPVENPAHYNQGRSIQPLAVIDDWKLDYYEGNALKYLARWRRKNGVQDLEKCRQMIGLLIERERRLTAAAEGVKVYADMPRA